MLDESIIADPGELNYLITKLLHNYLDQCERQFGETTYKALNDIMGVLSGAEKEFYRIKVIPYEDKKRRENGPV